MKQLIIAISFIASQAFPVCVNAYEFKAEVNRILDTCKDTPADKLRVFVLPVVSNPKSSPEAKKTAVRFVGVLSLPPSSNHLAAVMSGSSLVESVNNGNLVGINEDFRVYLSAGDNNIEYEEDFRTMKVFDIDQAKTPLKFNLRFGDEIGSLVDWDNGVTLGNMSGGQCSLWGIAIMPKSK